MQRRYALLNPLVGIGIKGRHGANSALLCTFAHLHNCTFAHLHYSTIALVHSSIPPSCITAKGMESKAKGKEAGAVFLLPYPRDRFVNI